MASRRWRVTIIIDCVMQHHHHEHWHHPVHSAYQQAVCALWLRSCRTVACTLLAKIVWPFAKYNLHLGNQKLVSLIAQIFEFQLI